MKFEKFEKEEIKMTNSSNVEISENNVITSINGVNVEEFNEKQKEIEEEEKEKKVKRHSFDDDMLNYNILFMLLGLGIGMVFGKLFVSNIAIAMCSGTLIGLVVGIVYTEYLIKKRKKNKEGKNE